MTAGPGAAPVALHCPRCRRPDGADGMYVHALEPAGAGARCPGCGADYRAAGGLVEATPAPAPDPLGALADPWPPDPEAWCAALADAHPDDAAFIEAWLLGTYAVAHHPGAAPTPHLAAALADQGALRTLVAGWLAARAPLDGPVLELGCGPGGLVDLWLGATAGPVVLCDARPAPLRLGAALARDGAVTVPWRRVGRRFTPLRVAAPPAPDPRVQRVVGDALDPPFAAESFALVAALSLVDSVADPWLLLGQLDALVAPRGLLLLASPYHLEARVQPPGAWVEGPGALRSALAGGLAGLEHVRFRVVEEARHVPWTVPSHDRLAHRYDLDVVLLERG